MWRGVLVVRTAGKLSKTLEELNRLEAELPDVKVEDGESLIALFELQNLLLAGRAIIKAALYRKESRGSHYRADYPSLHSDYGRPLLLTMNEAGLQLQEDSELGHVS
jgi:succinate dehydrogenase/fumarate reductase flavoprotein subunit